MRSVNLTIAVARRYSASNFCSRCSPFIDVIDIQNGSLYRALSSTTGSLVTSGGSFVKGKVAETSLEFSYHATSRFFSTTTVAVGRSRKRPRPWLRRRQRNGSLTSIDVSKISDGSTNGAGMTALPSLSTKNETSELRRNNNDLENDSSLPYPKGKPWRVLWPRPHGEPNSSGSSLSEFLTRIPTIKQLRRGWSMYKETWEDGITGIPSKHEDLTTKRVDGIEGSTMSSLAPSTITQQQLEGIGDNAADNLRIVRKDAQDILEQTKEKTGIHTQDDLKALASEAMKIATECIREFMAGYRKGRDSEIDKMLHEYFQEEEENTNGEKKNSRDEPEINNENSNGRTNSSTTTGVAGRKKKRKPKRGIPRI